MAMFIFPDGEKVTANTAEELVAKITGGWNPDTVAETAKVLARRAMIAEPNQDEPMEEFLQRLDAAGLLVYKA
jgi:hypothetical protein